MRLGFFVFERTGEIQFMSRLLEEVLGYSEDEWRGMLVVDLLAEGHTRNLDLFLCTGSVWGNFVGKDRRLGSVEIVIKEQDPWADFAFGEDSFVAFIQYAGLRYGERHSKDCCWKEYLQSVHWDAEHGVDLSYALSLLKEGSARVLERLKDAAEMECVYQVLRDSVMGEICSDYIEAARCIQADSKEFVGELRTSIDRVFGDRVDLLDSLDRLDFSKGKVPVFELANLVFSIASNVLYALSVDRVSLDINQLEEELELVVCFESPRSVDDQCILEIVTVVCERSLGGLFRRTVGDGGLVEFRVELPIEKNDDEEVMTEGETIVAEKHILVVEDNQLNAEILCYFLKDRGYTFEVVTNGALAVDAFRDGEYNLILMDIMLPEMSGYEATEEILKMAGERDIPPIIGVTAKVFRDDYDRCFQVGMCAVVHKPIDFEVLTSTLETHLSGKSETGGASDLAVQANLSSGRKVGGVLDYSVANLFIDRMLGDDGDRGKVIDHVVREFELGIERISESIAGGNIDEIERNAHSLKGSLGLVGARDAYDLAKGMELSAVSHGANFNPDHWLMLIRNAFEPLRACLVELKSE